jgi:predicted Zn finger-like uncharacterized protein
MILVCPACQTRYQVDDQAVTAAGRQVRCASCGHNWYQAPAVAAAEQAEAATEATALAIPRVDPDLDAPSPLAAAPAVPMPSRTRNALWAGALAAVVLLVAVLGALFGFRDRIVATWPATGHLYNLVGLPVEPLGAGLEIRKVVPTRTGDGLVVEGEIANVVDAARAVPRLRVTLLDPSNREVRSQIVDVPKNLLQPGEVTHFRAPFEPADAAASKVAVTFAAG